jgi:two-component system phosphate regulon sensor histidine kinase PhoR
VASTAGEARGIDADLVRRLRERVLALLEANRRLTQKAEMLAVEETRYRALFEVAPDGYLVTDLHGLIVEANDGAGRLLGRPHERLVRKPLAGFVDLPDRREFRHLLNELSEHGGARRVELELRAKTGVPLPVSATIGVVEAPDRVIQWILHDLSDYRRAEWEVRALNESLEARVQERTAEVEQERMGLQVLVEQLPTAVIMVDTRGEITLANAHAIALFEAAGVPLQLGRTYSELEVLHPDGRPYEPGTRPLDRALHRGESVAGELLEYRLADGMLRPFDVSAAPLRDTRGKIIGAVTSASDASAREARGRAEREFVANASHQLRNPVAAIRSAVEVLQSGAKDDPASRERFLEHIDRDSARLMRLTRSLLLLARSQALLESPRREVVALRPLLNEVAGRLEGRLHGRDGVTIDVRSSLDQATLVNRDLLEEALASLADNAVRHAGGRVVIASERRDGAIAVEVRDEGPGIPEQVQQQMFERFRGGNGSGFGLGLAIAAQAAEAIGASLEIESSPGSGTTARLTLPAVQMLTE